MRALWIRFRHYSSSKNCSLNDLYKEAFSIFLFVNKIPKQIAKVHRTKRELILDDETVGMLNALRKIASKRNQPLSIVVEEALQAYLDLPKNYMGKNMERSRHVEKIT